MAREQIVATRSVAFLRAINVGRRRVRMDALREIFEAAGYSGVETYIASGNVVFEAPGGDRGEQELAIEKVLERSLGFEVHAFVRPLGELAELASTSVFPLEDEESAHAVYVGFLKEAPGAEAAERIAGLEDPDNALRLDGRHLHWLMRVRSTESRLTGGKLERTLGVAATVRNMSTVRNLAALYG